MGTILVIGASGYFGSLLVEELLSYTQANIVMAGREIENLQRTALKLPASSRSRLSLKVVDLNSEASVEQALLEVNIAICAAGPYHRMSFALLNLCLRKGIHYLDLSDDRTFVRRVNELCDQHIKGRVLNTAVCTGWSTMPAISVLLAEAASEAMESVDEIHIQIAPGNRSPRSDATIESLLHSLGKPFQIWTNGRWSTVTGFSNPRSFAFPEPVGSRQGYLVDVPDNELFPPIFSASTVTFRVGAELTPFNYLSCALAEFVRIGIVKSMAPLLPLVKTSMCLLGCLGNDWGAVGVECSGLRNGQRTRRVASIVASHGGQYIPVMPATIMCTKLLSQGENYRGQIVLPGWLSRAELAAECSKRSYQLTVTEKDCGND
jgi:saccharopine dehydrogenase-like NADP-dependent oxidoreductase